MKVRCIDKLAPRSDGMPGPATCITVGKDYKVAEILTHTSQYSIINDEFKIARYSQRRFEVVDDSPVEPLRQAFNSLTTEMRVRIKQLESRLREF